MNEHDLANQMLEARPSDFDANVWQRYRAMWDAIRKVDTIRVPLLLFAMLSSACTPPYFFTIADVKAQLEAHRSEYESIAKTWSRKNPRSMFCYFGPDSFRWNGAFIEAVVDGYHIQCDCVMNQETVRTLGEAAQAVGTTPDELNHWISEARSLHIYCIQGGVSVVDISLEGSERSLYGLKYAVPGTDGMAELRRVAESDLGRTEVKHLFDEWFYYEDFHPRP